MAGRHLAFQYYYSMQCYNIHADNASTLIPAVTATVVSVFVLTGVLVILGPLVYTIKKKRKINER
jgi:hypothetical protein